MFTFFKIHNRYLFYLVIYSLFYYELRILHMNSTPPKEIYLGTCGWSYQQDWSGVFYPDWLNPSDYLNFYSQIFCSNEIDSTFYHIPSKKNVQNWGISTPDYFKFSAKIPQEITHKNKLVLNESKSILKTYFQEIFPLESNGKMLAHLLQLPPSFTFEDNFIQLKDFLIYWNELRDELGKTLALSQFNAKSWRLVVEFRHNSWMNYKTFDLLKEQKTGYCAVIEPLLPPRMDLTRNDIFYLRFHGFGKNPWFKYKFSEFELDHWASEILSIIETNKNSDICIYFNNHFSGNAVKNAIEIIPRLHITPKHDIETVTQEFEHKFKISRKKTQKRITIDSLKDKNFSNLDNWLKPKE